jgi:hypothetical protein
MWSACLLTVMPSGFDRAGLDLTHIFYSSDDFWILCRFMLDLTGNPALLKSCSGGEPDTNPF